MKIKELMDKLKEIADKDPETIVSIGVFDAYTGQGVGITEKFKIDWPSDVVLEVELGDLVRKDSIQRAISRYKKEE
jgi:hypothetical protein